MTKVAIIGSGNIGTDLMTKIVRPSCGRLELAAMAGIEERSAGLRLARQFGVPTTHHGVEELVELSTFDEVSIVLDATSARAHVHNNAVLRPYGRRIIDLTPAAIGPYTVPPVNLGEHVDEQNVNMVTCGGQATIPIVAAVAQVTHVRYAEIVASIASRSAGPGTRANIDEFTRTTADGIEQVGGAAHGKAIIILNPAEPPMLMRDTVHCLVDELDEAAIERSVAAMVSTVQGYVPGFRSKHPVQFTPVERTDLPRPGDVPKGWSGWKVTVFLEVEGAGDYLPPYAGNLDVMTAAAVRTAELLADADVKDVAAR